MVLLISCVCVYIQIHCMHPRSFGFNLLFQHIVVIMILCFFFFSRFVSFGSILVEVFVSSSSLINCHLKNISCLFLSIVNYCVLNGWMMMMIGQPFSSSSFFSPCSRLAFNSTQFSIPISSEWIIFICHRVSFIH